MFRGMPDDQVCVTFGVLDASDGMIDCCVTKAFASVHASDTFQPFSKGYSFQYVILGDGTHVCHNGHGNNLAGLPSELIGCFGGRGVGFSNAEMEPGILSPPQISQHSHKFGSVPGVAERRCAIGAAIFSDRMTVLTTTFSKKNAIIKAVGCAVVDSGEVIWPPTVKASLAGVAVVIDMVCPSFTPISRYKASE